MMLSASPAAVTRSSLEAMLESIRQRDEALEKSKDLPPALPARPTSRARLPSARKSLPTDFKVGANGEMEGQVENVEVDREKEDAKRKEKELGYKTGNFGSKKMRKDQNCADSNPYTEEKKHQAVRGPVAGSMPKVEKPKRDDNIGYFTKEKLRVWCQLANGQWGSGKIQSTTGNEAVVSLSDGNFVKVRTADLLPANPDILEGVDDLIKLSYLNEPSVLYNLKLRSSKDMIYSKAGPVLIAVNPFKPVPLYGEEVVEAYRQKFTDSPHVYAIADTAYSEMMRDAKNQSIIVSGESGAGKTETAKHALQYLAVLGGGIGGIESEVLQANCVLEAFGNAKTCRNDNSSRFGKLIEIRFSLLGKMCGAKIQTFLLEKSRVVQLANGERSYHIFYQLCAGAPSILRERLNIKAASEYNYLSQSKCLVVDGVDDALKFHKLMEAMDIVQISKADQEQAFAMLAAILWLGNISFQVIDNENHVRVLADEALTSAAKLMGCSIQELMLTLSTHKVQSGKNYVVKNLTFQQAIGRRDALSKFIYASLFDWLVDLINKSLEMGKLHTGRSINILDIYGFESFKNNSFEQLYINYANERLQQHFNRHLFKLEQEEYEEDGIDWSKVDFDDNQDCLNLFEKKPLGLISLLDEESNFPNATDLTFANKLKQHLSGNPCFRAEKGRAFAVQHYAGQVAYDPNGFLEKNRDPLHSDIFQLLSSCSYQLPQFVLKISDQSEKFSCPSNESHGLESSKPSVATRLKGQLFKLMHQLENTTPHFIRCIKPNGKQIPVVYEDDLVLQQLRCCGILEVVRISRSGYPTRRTHQDFAQRYGFLLSDKTVPQDPLSISVGVLQRFNILPEMYQVGYTKVYLRTGQIAKLEERRKQVLHGVIGVQKFFRGCQVRRYVNELLKGVTVLQSFVRGDNARRYQNSKRCTVSRDVPPSVVDKQLVAVICLQSVIRGWLVRKQFNDKCKLKELNDNTFSSRRKYVKKISEVKVIPQEQVDLQATILLELQKQVAMAEVTLGQKEQENALLREQLQQFERGWSEYETKMKKMEETWQRQMESLQTSLAAARKSLAADNTAGQQKKFVSFASPRYYDSDDNVFVRAQPLDASTPITDMRSGNSMNAINILSKEFEQRKQHFDQDARALSEFKPGQSASDRDPDEELRKLKISFETWKKDYKVRLQETKVKIHKVGRRGGDKTRKWWRKIMV